MRPVRVGAAGHHVAAADASSNSARASAIVAVEPEGADEVSRLFRG